MAQPVDIMRTQLAMGLGSTSYKTLINIIALNIYDRLVATYPSWWPTVKGACCRRQKHQPASPPPPSNKEIRCTIECERILQSSNAKQQQQQPTNTKMDAVVNYITTIPVVRNLICMTHHDYLPNEFEPLQIEPDLFFQLISLKHHDGQVESIKFKLFCYEHEIQYLQVFVDKCNLDYERRMLNKLGTSLYFFDMMTESKNKRTMNNPLPTSHIMYTKHKFYTTRSFDNVFFEQRPKVRKHVDFFLTRKDWYEKKGIPYTLGFLFHGDPGCGKCLGKDTPILMADGSIKLVQDVVVGDKLMGDDSNPRNVISLARGRENLFKVVPVKGDPYVVNESHILSLKVSKSHKKDMKNGDIIDLPVKEFNNYPKGYLKGYKVGVNFQENDVPIDPYLLGYWLGDGCSTKAQITTADMEIVDYFAKALDIVDCEIVKGSDEYGWNIRSKDFNPKCSRTNEGCNVFLTFLKNSKLINNKHIPDVYKINSREVRLSVLAGLIDSDGHVYGNCADICLVNERLLDDIIFMARSLGFAAYKSKCVKTCTNGKNGPVSGTYYRTIIHGECMEQIPTILKRKHLAKRKQIKNALVTGITLEPLGEGDYYGFEIDGNHRFLLGDFTVTHNTSTVKAIANTARRHIINIQLSEIKSKAQLRHLFFNEEIHVHNGTTTEKYTIPIHERLYVIEDIDAMGDAVLRREWKKPTVEEKPKKTGDPWMDKEEESKEPLDLAFLLNLLDGTLESAGRIIAISSNFPERIDRALIRPGRIDMIVHFKKCNREILKEMVVSFYDKEVEGLDCPDYKWSPAEVNQILFRNFDKPEDAVQELNTLAPKDLYGFDPIENGTVSYEAFMKETLTNGE